MYHSETNLKKLFHFLSPKNPYHTNLEVYVKTKYIYLLKCSLKTHKVNFFVKTASRRKPLYKLLDKNFNLILETLYILDQDHLVVSFPIFQDRKKCSSKFFCSVRLSATPKKLNKITHGLTKFLFGHFWVLDLVLSVTHRLVITDPLK